MLPDTYNPLLKGGLNSMNNYPFDAMPCINARRWTRTTELEREQIYSLSSLPLDYTCLIKRLVRVVRHLEHPSNNTILQFAVIFVIITDSVICDATATIFKIICSMEQWRVRDSNSCVTFQRPNGLANRPLHQTWVTLQFKMRF